MDLTTIKDALLSVRIYAELRQPTEDNPLPHVTALLDDEETNNFLLEISYLPGIEGELEHTKLLQLFIPILEPSPQCLDETSQLVSFLNQTVPLPGFILDRESEFVYLRHILPIPVTSQGDEYAPVFLDIVFLLFYIVALYADVIGQVASGEKRFEEVLFSLAED
jgi:hypothetical protein